MGHLSADVPASEASLDRVLEMLADRRRRATLLYLSDATDNTAAVHELVEDIVGQECDAGQPDREQVAVRLHHVTLPKLADAGVIEYDDRSGAVRYRRHPLVTQCLELCEEV